MALDVSSTCEIAETAIEASLSMEAVQGDTKGVSHAVGAVGW